MCWLGLNLDETERSAMTGVTARIEEGRVVSCHDGLDIKANAWAAATAADWLDTVVEPDAKRAPAPAAIRWLSAPSVAACHKTLLACRSARVRDPTWLETAPAKALKARARSRSMLSDLASPMRA